MTKQPPDSKCQSGYEPDEKLEITDAMVAAGVYTAREHPLGASLEDLVRAVFLAMMLEASD